MSHSRLAFPPHSREALRCGFNKLADAMEPALGPFGRLVVIERDQSHRAPEMLNDGATIARRFHGFPDRFETMGAHLARHIAWQVEETVGDGATTAVVIARHIFNEADRHVAAGYNVMQIRRGLEDALSEALSALEEQGRPLDDPAQIEYLATSITGNEPLGKYVEEVFDVVGQYGAIDVRTNYGRTHACRYINGTFWNQGWVSSYFTTESGKAVVKEPYILFTNRDLVKAEDLLPIMEQVQEEGKRGLVVIAPGVSGDALNILVANKTRDILPTLAIKAPGLGPEKTEILQDLAVLTGGTVFLVESGDRVDQANLKDLGQAREVQAIRSGFTLIGGRGRPAAIRQRTQEVRDQIPDAPYGYEKRRLVERAGKLLGGVALLEIGGATDTERDYMKDRTKEAIQTVRLGMQDGIVPGGGVALLACASALDSLHSSGDKAVGVEILRSALVAPMRAILRNSGYDPGAIIAEAIRQGNGYGFDVVRGEITDVFAAQIVDPLKVLQVALKTGVSGAMMAITTDVLVHRPRENRDEEVDFRA